jgi:glycosyltransferase involved in cell wall biosynthesis
VSTRRTHVVIAVENISFDRDPRARLFARSLARAGFDVSVVCPRSDDPALRRAVDGIRVHSFPTAPFDRLGLLGHLLEYAWSCMAIGTLLVAFRLRRRADIGHLCVPPHLLFVVARALRLLGCRIVVDQHDLMPELFLARYGERHRILHRAVLAAERAAVRAADLVLTPNASGARVAVERGGADPRYVRIVSTGPLPEEMERLRRLGQSPNGRPTTVGYVGNIGPQDGVDLLVHAARHAADQLGSDAVRFVCVGSGDDLPRVRTLAKQVGVEALVEFTGRLAHDDALRRLNACDICVQPDPRNAFTDSCTMVKSLEYMALAKPVVAFDLVETRAACDDAALYASRNSPQDLAAKIVTLARDPALRRRLGTSGAKRVANLFSWEIGEAALLDAYADPVLHEPRRGLLRRRRREDVRPAG